MHLVPIPGCAGASETEALMAHLSAETTALRICSRKSTVVLTAYAKWSRQSDAKEAGASAAEP
jgi:hypothetical protein